MLILRRRVGERVVVGGEVEITVASVGRGGVRLAVRAPAGVSVLRGETHDAVVAANTEAILASNQDLEFTLVEEPA